MKSPRKKLKFFWIFILEKSKVLVILGGKNVVVFVFFGDF